MHIRHETVADIEAITAVTTAAFANHPFSHQTEQYIIHALRAAHALTLSLVAEVEGRVVGHVAVSPVTIAGRDDGWYGLGPVSVQPEYQRQGIGSALIREGLRQLHALGAHGCVLVGDPGYYMRFGFRNRTELTLADVPPQYFLALPFGDDISRGAVVFHAGFSATC
jgi:putative acetyltransferase